MIIDHSLFETPVTPEEIQDFKNTFYPGYKPFNIAAITLLSVVLVAGIVLYFSGMQFGVNTDYELLSYFVVFATVPQLYNKIVPGFVFQKRIKTSIKAYRFARAHNFEYIPEVRNPFRPGFVFLKPNTKRRVIYDVISRNDANPFEIGNYYYETGSSRRSREIHRTCYIRITLDRNLPNMVLDATADDTKFFGIRQSNLGVTFSKDQAMRLEGNFNDYFTLYAPKEYETDALYVFTPDLMALLIDEASLFNAEIVDNNLYIYSINLMSLDKPETYERLFSILDTVGAKALTQTDSYRDTRSDVSGVVDSSGRRLNRGLSVTATIILVFFIIIYIVQNVPEYVEIFSH